jgi:hypothetical protein
MTQSKTGYNINGANFPHQGELEKHFEAINPRWLLVMDNDDLARDYGRRFQNTNIAIRNWALTQGDENAYSMTPAAWLEARLVELGITLGNLYLHTGNEAGIAAKWHIDLMKLIVQRNLKMVKLVICNVAVGTPSDINEWKRPEMREFFQLLDEHRDQFVLGLHEYFCGIAPSGFIGGFPDGSWTDGRTNLHPNYEDRRNWPEDASNIGTLWHCGRFKVVNDAARSFGYQPPRIVITEHGADALADMALWVKKFPISDGYGQHRAWKSLGALWAKLLPGRSHQQAYFENVQYLKTAVYDHFPNIEGWLLFTLSGNFQWNEFDMSEADEFHKLLEKSVEVVIPAPALPAFPADFDSRAKPYMVRATDGATTVRAKPSQNADMLTTISPLPCILKLIDAADLRPNERVQQTIGDRLGVWLPVVVGTVKGWSFNAYLDVQPVILNPQPDVVKWQVVIDYQGTAEQKAASAAMWTAFNAFLQRAAFAVYPTRDIQVVDKP